MDEKPQKENFYGVMTFTQSGFCDILTRAI